MHIELNFEKRVNVWRKYRDEINKESLKLSNPFQGDTRISKYVKIIQSIDSNILKNINSDLNVSVGNNAVIDFTSQYEALAFNIDKLDANLLNKISQTINVAEECKRKRFIVDEKGKLVEGVLEKISRLDRMLFEIDTKIQEMNKVIQYFPKTAAEDLQVLDNSLRNVKTKKEPISPALKVNPVEVKDSKDLKIPFYISMGLILFSAIMILIMVILIIIL